jgi:TonB family protein
MKRCKACDEEFEDKFSFCPVDATPLNELAAALVGEDLTWHEFHLTMINSTALPERLATEIRYALQQGRREWSAFSRDPIGFGRAQRSRIVSALAAPNSLSGIVTALTLVLTATLVLVLSPNGNDVVHGPDATSDQDLLAHIIEFPREPEFNRNDKGVGVGSDGRVGFAAGRGEGSAPEFRKATGGGGGGNHDPLPAQQGRPPQPSPIPAPIPKFPPLTSPALPVAGIDIDPALWKQLPMPGYGDPRSTSTLPSKGPGDGGGMGNSSGTGIGDGLGPGVGPGQGGNTGGGTKGLPGGGDPGGSDGNNPYDPDRVYRSAQVTERARVISKPEPQYTEDARRNQVTGTVILRAVFSRSGDVTNIRAVNALPFGLTERAIAAARLIRFRPATKDGRPVNVYMQLEYNFNLY